MIRIYLFKRGRIYYMKWKRHGREFRESTGERTKAKAKDVVAQKRSELEQQAIVSRVGVDEISLRYEQEFLSGKSTKHIQKFRSAWNKLETLESPELITDIDGDMVARMCVKMRDEGRSEATLHCYVGYIKRALEWAHRKNLITAVPFIDRPRIPAEGAARGRPLTGEEIERYLAKIESVVGPEAKASFEFLVTGLNVSGLRLGEALRLHWPGTKGEPVITVHLGVNPILSIPAKAQKRRKFQKFPITPDFAKLLRQVPKHRRTGFVFQPLKKRSGKRIERTDTVSKRLSAIGEKAGIIVNHKESTGEPVFASAQDFRRTFGLRWAKRLKPAELKGLMRHSSVETTMKYYAISDAGELAASLEERFGAEQIAKEQSEKLNF